MKRLALITVASVAIWVCDLDSAAQAAQRSLLWTVVQTCLLNHNVTGNAFPCLAVNTDGGGDSGYALIKPFDGGRRIIVSPTVRTVGIESARLRGGDAPNYFADAWAARHFVTDDLPKRPSRSDLALAVNSRPGRSQDQLHIHVSCIRPDVKASIAKIPLDPSAWHRAKILPGTPVYTVRYEPRADLARLNVFDDVAAGLQIPPGKMDEVTIVIVGVDPSGFLLMARRKLPNGSDEPHGEGLLDPACRAFGQAN